MDQGISPARRGRPVAHAPDRAFNFERIVKAIGDPNSSCLGAHALRG
jgi:hypothetical protein